MKVVYLFLILVFCTFNSRMLVAKEAASPLTVPLSDSTLLRATVFLPETDEAKPVILQITPYGRDEATERGEFFRNHGYVFIAVDSRGTGDSQGEFVPFADDGKDAYDIVEWAAKQSFSDGQVATLGGSYRGFVQWSMQKFSPPSLKSMIAIASVYPGKDFPLRNNIFVNYTMSWLNMVSKAGKGASYGGGPWNELYLKQKNNGLAFSELDKLAGNQTTEYQTWLQHPKYDDYWQGFVPNADNYRAINVPILSVTGHYDGDQHGTLLYYLNHQKWGRPEVFDQHYLIMGPWDHGGTRYPKPALGQLQLGERSVLDMKQVYLDWFNWTLKGKDKPRYLKGKISKYIQKAGTWHASKQLAQGHWHTLYLTRTKRPALSASPSVVVDADRRHSHYVYDPMRKVSAPSAFDLSGEAPLWHADGEKLVFDSAELSEDLVLSGQIQARLWLSINVPDTDFHASVFEVCPENKPLLLAFAMKRARYRNGLQKPEMVTPGQPFSLNMDDFNYVSRVLSKGCKLRFVVSSSSWYHQKHYNGESAVAYQTAKDAKVAKVTLWHDNTYVSQLRLPVLETVPASYDGPFPLASKVGKEQ
ncbi:hypothetical protein PRUB_a1059 [Pseudoalteromonas rubra]|uniref:Xaa-Pro dipeptidyl-peptidase C-terminal domain-containing protein n=2 Tax=Pseudoalteromonas rubra TaxID=43658 RepID=A0A8T0C786_9GAMM|nr:hypothetical protein PRUB_a1059 [Pseudoalteromonas rubra]